MNAHRKHRLFVTITLAAALSSAATATATAAPMTKLPPEHTSGAITYLSGGIGSDQSTQLRREEPKFPLTLEFVQGGDKRHDLYLADVQVQISNRAGKQLLATRSDGPFLLARLPDGHYTVSAEHAGRTETRSVQVSREKPQLIVFNWTR